MKKDRQEGKESLFWESDFVEGLGGLGGRGPEVEIPLKKHSNQGRKFWFGLWLEGFSDSSSFLDKICI